MFVIKKTAMFPPKIIRLKPSPVFRRPRPQPAAGGSRATAKPWPSGRADADRGRKKGTNLILLGKILCFHYFLPPQGAKVLSFSIWQTGRPGYNIITKEIIH